MQTQKITFIVNPKAGTRKKFNTAIIDQLIGNTSYTYQVLLTESKGHATQLAHEAVEDKVDIVVACGGDGTVNEVAKGLIDSSCVLGIIPLGSGNGLARHLGVPMNNKKAIQFILNSHRKRINAGSINDKLFFCAAGVGFDAHIAKKFSHSKKRGLLSYIQLILKEFWRYPTFSVTLPDNEQIWGNLFLCSIANADQFGNDFKLVRDKKITDPFLTLVLVEKPTFFQFFQLAWHARFGDPSKLAFVHTFNIGVEQTIKGYCITAPNTLCHLDGEPTELGKSKICIKQRKEVLWVCAGGI
jgi:diacylglycerol kinase (ATP)